MSPAHLLAGLFALSASQSRVAMSTFWEQWLAADGYDRLDPLSSVEYLIGCQRRFSSMLDKGIPDAFYSRSDLRMLLDSARDAAKDKLLELCSELECTPGSMERQVLHAAAALRISPANAAQLVRDYHRETVEFVDGTTTSPLHVASGAVGAEHAERVRVFLDAFPTTKQQTDNRGLPPLHNSLLSSARLNVVKMLVDAWPLSVRLPMPSTYRDRLNSRELIGLEGLTPSQLAACCSAELDVIFFLCRYDPDSLLCAQTRAN